MSQKSANIIRKFLSDHNLSITLFAENIGVGRITVYRWLKGGPIRPWKAKDVEEAYKGLIKASDLLEE